MDKIVAYCGTVCSECPAYQATQKDCDEERKRVAEMWSKQFNTEIRPEEIDCEGCTSAAHRLFSYTKVCEIRKCAQEKGLKNCAYCSEYPCEKLSKFFQMAPEAKRTLDEIRKGLQL